MSKTVILLLFICFLVTFIDILFAMKAIFMIAKIRKWSLISVLVMPLEISACREVLVIMWSIAVALVFVTLVCLLMSEKMVCWKHRLKNFVAGALLE